MVQVSERYLPSLLERISSVAGSKSGAWRFTTSITACAYPAWVSPMTLMGNSQGKARTGASLSGMGGGAHHARLILLVQPVDLHAYRAGLSRADRLAVERGDGKHLARGRGHPDLVGGAQLALLDGADLVGNGVVAQDLEHHVVGDSGQYQVRLRRAEDGSVLHDEDVARRGLGELALAHQDRLDAALVRREGAQHAVAQQRGRLDVAARPAEVGEHDRLGARPDELRRGRDQLARHEEHRGLQALREGVVAPGRAARDLEIDVLVLPGV